MNNSKCKSVKCPSYCVKVQYSSLFVNQMRNCLHQKCMLIRSLASDLMLSFSSVAFHTPAVDSKTGKMALFIQYDLKLENECYDSAQMFHALCVHTDKRACGSLCHSQCINLQYQLLTGCFILCMTAKTRSHTLI